MAQVSGTETVTVGSKLPHGFLMELIEMGVMTSPAPRSELVVEVKGANSLRVKGTNPGVLPVAYTTVDASLAREWFKRNKDLKFVKNGSVFMNDSASAAASMGKDRTEVVTGLEPLDPEKSLQPGVQADKEHLARLTRTTL